MSCDSEPAAGAGLYSSFSAEISGFSTMVTMVFMGLYTIGDTIVVSRFVSTDALSAVNIVTPVINLIVGLGSMLAMGGGAVIGRTLGEGRGEEASKSLPFFCVLGWLLEAS